MGQERYHNYGRPLQSLPENYRLLGAIANGVYAGFDSFEIVSGTTLKLKHNLTGSTRLKLDGSGNEGPFGCFVTKQGVVVYDDTEVQVAVDLAVVHPRIDVLVANHTFLDSPGGSPASFSIIKGAEAAFPSEPNIALPLSQIKLGTFIVYPGADHSATIWVRADIKKLGGQFPFGTKTTEKDLATSPEQDFNKVEASGIYFMDNVTTNRPTTQTAYWTLIVFRKGDRLSQLALETQSGRAYVRAALSFTNGRVTNWGSWINLNNPDVPAVDLTPVWAAIGSQLYTQSNYIISGESLSTSVDKLDIALKAIDIILDQAVIDIDNLESIIGTRAYDENNIILDSETITASLNKLDKSWGKASFGNNLNTYTQPGTYYLSGTATNAPTSTLQEGSILHVIRNGNFIRQFVIDWFFGYHFERSSSNSGSTWNGWSLKKLGELMLPINNWNMLSTTEFSVAHGLGHRKRIRTATAVIWPDEGESIPAYMLLSEPIDGNSSVAGTIRQITDANIVLGRKSSAYFDDVKYNSSTQLRGYLILGVVPANWDY